MWPAQAAETDVAVDYGGVEWREVGIHKRVIYDLFQKIVKVKFTVSG